MPPSAAPVVSIFLGETPGRRQRHWLIVVFPRLLAVGMASDTVTGVSANFLVLLVHLALLVAVIACVAAGVSAGMAGSAVSIGAFVINRERVAK